MTTVGYILIAAALLTAGAVVAWNRWRIRRLLKRMDDMLEKAIDEGFTEEGYDESLLSAVEAKLARYLASSTVSARNLQAEKDKIKTLIADISHQTKTPLSNVLLYAQPSRSSHYLRRAVPVSQHWKDRRKSSDPSLRRW